MTESTNEANGKNDRETASSTYRLFILGMSIYAIIGWIGIFILPLPASTKSILIDIDRLVSLVFLYDFLRNLFSAPDKLAYMKWGWLDLLSSIPTLPILRILRLASIIRTQRYLKRTSGKKILETYREKQGESALLSTVFALFIVLLIGSILVLDFESESPDANITNADDAIWWSIVTMTTVGYGDKVPVTLSGRLVGMVVMTAGVAMVGVLTGYLANAFAPQDKEVGADLVLIKEELAEIKRLLRENRPNDEASEP
jgi:voltage-gated potassium channel